MEQNKNSQNAVGKLVVRHAGSLNASFSAVHAEFKNRNPHVEIEDIPGGSAGVLKLVMEGNPCDVLASADYQLFASWMIPEFAEWYIIFTPNEFMLRCAENAPYSNEINADNWYEILQREGVRFWRPDPDDDPGGYRTLMIFQLAERFYGVTGLYDKLMSEENSFVPTRDQYHLMSSTYTFAYRSSPVPDDQWNIKLPDEINLGNDKFSDYYKHAEVRINGKNPGEKLTLNGEPMLFGITIPNKSENKTAALEWLKFILSDNGSGIMADAGMPLANPVQASDLSVIPDEIKEYLK